MDADAWIAFSTAASGASAALVGLFIVAMSVNVERIVAIPTMPSRAGATIASLMAVVVVSLLALVPTVSAVGYAVVAAVVSAAAFAFAVESLVRLVRANTRGALPRGALTAVPSLVMLAGALLVPADADLGLSVVAVGFGLALVASVVNAWVLLIEIRR